MENTSLTCDVLSNITAQYKYLKQLLIDKRIGDILCQKFR